MTCISGESYASVRGDFVGPDTEHISVHFGVGGPGFIVSGATAMKIAV